MSGTKVNGIFPGTFVGIDVAVYSYQAVKNLPTADSGMICFANKEYDAIVRKLSWLGINKDTYMRTTAQGTYSWKYDVDYLGYKDHGNSIMAAIGLVQLKYLDEDNVYRRKLVSTYDDAFKNNENVCIIGAPYKDECSFHIYEIAVPDRDGLMAFLASHDIFAGVHYRDNTEYTMYAYDHGKCPHAHEISQKIITLPLHLELSAEDVKMIAGLVNEFTGS
jgi:dTDP-4-amino-4,6-dideoxygalactose transaminase